MKENKKKLQVSAIKDGTVIDHIPANNLFKVINILNLQKLDSLMSFGANLESEKLGKKAIIKVENKYFINKDINKIALVAPTAKLNVIKDYEVVDKMVVEVPDEISGIAKCVNPQCITNNEPVTTKFKVIPGIKVALKCSYCEKITDQEHMIIF